MADDDLHQWQLLAALRAFNTSAMNGIILLAARLRGAGLLDDEHLREFHEGLSLPLEHADVADNPFIVPMQEIIDSRLAALATLTR
ncbi:hypothetical protein [Sphingomonas kyeonggiensis]|uniref:Uncharacterized protein n=1 Tax=Sphingomonas kyeonggiensis TaxID=1268553 RepID=A0A7W6JWF6_9SPHN|nr:hypothetical protein [Sphingomonas kyeonggiensis]MBB4099782.1 hypothetical protein [Sphingomonas kyeonggiensis]